MERRSSVVRSKPKARGRPLVQPEESKPRKQCRPKAHQSVQAWQQSRRRWPRQGRPVNKIQLVYRAAS